MAILFKKSITALLGKGITATFEKHLSEINFNLDIFWANGESALDYGIEISADSARSLIEALKIVIAESEEK